MLLVRRSVFLKTAPTALKKLDRVKYWGTGAFMKSLAPSWAKDPAIVAQFAKFERLSASPGAYKPGNIGGRSRGGSGFEALRP